MAETARGEAIARALQLLRELLAGPVSAGELAARLGWGIRTVHRDIAAMARAGIAVDEIREGRRIAYRVRPESILEALGIDR